jgi:hypothetical protein
MTLKIKIFNNSSFNGDVPLDIERIPEVDAVIISHDHYDHLNKYSVQKLIDKVKNFIAPLAVGNYLEDWGVPRDKIVELDWWQEYRLDHNLMIAATPAQHFSGRGLFDRNATLWASWVIQTPFHSVFFSGDSGYFNGFKQIGTKYGPFDMTLKQRLYQNRQGKVPKMNEKRMVITGATGMVGGCALRLSLENPDASQVTAIGRKSTDIKGARMGEVVADDLTDFSTM